MNQFRIYIITVVFAIASACTNKKEYYVAPDGNDSNRGTIESPFATIQKAVAEIKAAKDAGNKSTYKVVIREGKYELKEPIVFQEKDSGTDKNPVIFTAYEDEDVIISGGIYFKADDLKGPGDDVINRILDEEAKNKIKVLDLKLKGITDYGEIKHIGYSRPILSSGIELYQGNKAMQLSSWPGEGYVRINKVIDRGSVPRNDDYSNRGGSFQYESSRPSLWSNPGDLWVQGIFGTVWADDMLKVASIDTSNKTIVTVKPHLYGITGGHFRFSNILEEISKPGDYYIDREKGVAYIYPYNEKEDISVSMMEEPLVALEGASHIKFENICFENGRGLGAYVENGHYNKFVNCTFRNFGSYAVSFGKGIGPFESLRHEGIGQPESRIVGSLRQHIYADVTLNREAGANNGLVSCEIYNTGAGGVSLGGGDIKQLEPAHNYVDGCEIHNTGLRYQTYAPSIDITGVGNRVSGCRIYDSPHSAIIYYGNEHIIENNEIYRVLLESDDGGAIYTGRDVTSIGTVIRNNFIHHVGSQNPNFHHRYWHAIYLDDYTGSVTIENNVFADIPVGVLISGRNIICNNNFVIRCERPIVIQHRAWTAIQDQRLKQVDAFSGIWAEKYPELQKIKNETEEEKGKYWGTQSINNVSVGSNNPCTMIDRVDSLYLTVKGNLDFSNDEINDLFVDPANRDYTLKENTSIFKENPEIEKIDFNMFLKK